MSDARTQMAWGFLTILDSDEQGLIGGYLVLNQTGRPLEFHCTAPVKANRAQQILFGPTLQPYLYGEQIGQTLVAKGSARPTVVYTDVEPALAMRDFVDMPVALVLPRPRRPRDRPAPSGGSTAATRSLSWPRSPWEPTAWQSRRGIGPTNRPFSLAGSRSRRSIWPSRSAASARRSAKPSGRGVDEVWRPWN